MAIDITSVNQVMDVDDTVALFEVNKTHEGQNEHYWVVMNSEGDAELARVHQWLIDNDQPIPPYSSRIVT